MEDVKGMKLFSISKIVKNIFIVLIVVSGILVLVSAGVRPDAAPPETGAQKADLRSALDDVARELYTLSLSGMLSDINNTTLNDTNVFSLASIADPSATLIGVPAPSDDVDAYVGFTELVQHARTIVESQGLSDEDLRRYLYDAYPDALARINSAGRVSEYLNADNVIAVPDTLWSGGAYIAKGHFVGDTGLGYYFRSNADGTLPYNVTYAADNAMMASWISLYDCTASEFTAVSFLGISKGNIEESRRVFDDLNTDHEYTLFITAVADKVSSDRLSVLIEIEQQ
jgi:hypothetical protein